MSKMVGVLSILEGPLLHEAMRLWKLFETDYRSSGVQSFDHPNVSFQGGHSQQVAAVERALAQPTRYVSPFEIIVDGWNCLESSNTVFLSVVPTQEPKRGHQLVNDLLKQQCRDLFDRYLPSQWQPHITVAMQDLSDEGLQRAKGDLRAYHPCYRQILSNLHLVHLHQAAHRIEIVHSVRSYVLRR